MRTYCAKESSEGKYGIYTIGPCGDFSHTDCREFNNFDDANSAAEYIALGFGHLKPGHFVNMR